MLTNAETLDVLVVENHPDTLHYLTMFLEGQGHAVECASTVADALTMLAQKPVDILICDIGLEDGTGWDLIAQLPRPIFAIAMSGYGMKADRERSREAGFREHLIKPFSLKRLAELIEEARAEAARG